MAMETIVILDREQHMQRALKTLLEDEKYIVIALESIDRAQQDFSEFEVAGFITEYWINNSPTLEAIRKLKRAFPDAYVMMLTNARVENNEYDEILSAGVDDFFRKPFSPGKILAHLKKGLKRRSLIRHGNQLEQEGDHIKARIDLKEVKQNPALNEAPD